jgi:hypothetical protein
LNFRPDWAFALCHLILSEVVMGIQHFFCVMGQDSRCRSGSNATATLQT